MKLNNLLKNQQFMFMAMVLLGGFFSLWVVGDLSTPILTSIVLALLFRPMQVYFTKIGVPERLSVFITFFTAVSLATLFLLIFIGWNNFSQVISWSQTWILKNYSYLTFHSSMFWKYYKILVLLLQENGNVSFLFSLFF